MSTYNNLKYISFRVVATLVLNMALAIISNTKGLCAEKNHTILINLEPITELLPLDILKAVKDLLKTLPTLHHLLVLLVELLEKIVPLLKDIVRTTGSVLHYLTNIINIEYNTMLFK